MRLAPREGVIMRLPVLVALACLLLSPHGCASILAGKSRDVPIASDPPGADVIVNGERYGTTPTTLRLRHGRDYTLRLQREGMADRSFVLRSRVDAFWVVLDFVCGIFPLLVDLSTQAWRQLDVYEVNAAMHRPEATTAQAPSDADPYVSVPPPPLKAVGKNGIELPITILLDGGVEVLADGMQPQSFGSYKVDLGSGNFRYIDGSKIKRITSANRLDLTRAVLEEKRRVP
jgi:hypothetical protein